MGRPWRHTHRIIDLHGDMRLSPECMLDDWSNTPPESVRLGRVTELR